jgi:hypothetical protein
MWWEHILNFSKRDQMSFDFCRLQSGLKLNNFEGTKFENVLIHEHNNAAGGRLLASFDQRMFNRLKAERLDKGLALNQEAIDQIKRNATREPSSRALLEYLSKNYSPERPTT